MSIFSLLLKNEKCSITARTVGNAWFNTYTHPVQHLWGWFHQVIRCWVVWETIFFFVLSSVQPELGSDQLTQHQKERVIVFHDKLYETNKEKNKDPKSFWPFFQSFILLLAVIVKIMKEYM